MERETGSGRDRISSLPDPILQSILSLVPLKSAIRTSVLSKRWTHLWLDGLVFATRLDFGDDLSCNQPPESFVATVNRYLQLHGGDNLDELRILFNPSQPFHFDYVHWIAFAASKRVKVLDLYLPDEIKYLDLRGEVNYNRDRFRLPICLYACKYLSHLSLSRCKIYHPKNFSSLSSLQSLSLSHVYITDKMLVTLLSVCLHLESLSITHCADLIETRFTSPNLRRLVLGDCWCGYKLWLSAPKLESFRYFGHIYFHNYFIDVSSLVDTFVCLIGRNCEVDGMEKLTHLFHAKILTICPATLMTVATFEKRWALPLAIRLENLQELQILMDSMDYPHLACIYYFLWRSTFLSKLFIRLPGDYEAAAYDDEFDFWINDGHFIERPPPGVVFDHIKAIKLSNFSGDTVEMKLVNFLLGKAIVLETLLLVAPRRICSGARARARKWRGLTALRAELALFPKASTYARITLCGFSEYDDSLHPMHSDYYYDHC